MDFALGLAVQVSVVVMLAGLLSPVPELVSVQFLHVVHSQLQFVQRRMKKIMTTMRMAPRIEPTIAPMTARDNTSISSSGGNILPRLLIQESPWQVRCPKKPPSTSFGSPSSDLTVQAPSRKLKNWQFSVT